MRVLHIIASLDKNAGGPSRSVPQTCLFLSKQHIHIHLVTAPSDHPVEIPTNKHFQVSFRSLIHLIKFGLQLNKKQIDIIHLQHIWNPYIHIMALMARLKGIPYIITPRGMLEPWIMQRHSWKKKIALLLYQHRDLKKASFIHVTCEAEKETVRQLGYTNQVAVIPNGIDLTKLPPPKNNYGSKKIVFLSRLHPKKGIEILLEAWHKIKEEKWQLEIAGDGDPKYIASLKQLIQTKNIANVTILEPQYGQAKWDFIKQADLFILPTYSENFGIVIAEALAVGVPVITTTGTPWKELIAQQCGWWIDLSVDHLVNTLQQAMATPPSQLQQMGVNGRQLIQEKYDMQAIASKIKTLYQSIQQ
jgi:glycosyltransferase involved in cell wall biosynthesis